MRAGSTRAGCEPNGTVECWGEHYHRTDAPDGRFISVVAGGDTSCGLRPDNTIECWGPSYVQAPENWFLHS